jgi:TRAP-type mannitol/chloroaromatic compound transport system permease large subunit
LLTIYKGMADYMVIQVIALTVVSMWPEVALWLVRALR